MPGTVKSANPGVLLVGYVYVCTRRFYADPLYVTVDLRLGVEGIPTTAYRTAEEVEVRTSNRYYNMLSHMSSYCMSVYSSHSSLVQHH
jgi:hypothetical protein